ncbi:hypothetical protein QAC88_08005 [Staphylococcus aureus]|nr:hypothetical protein [Staphylococcus aureus]MDT3855529.1 hypothetical protein [Staphylococcus aureus]MDT3877485.1 hypothetical protein [Staphylococcus aureus]MDT4032937.1 hypothetical protein [Staphylococcus aureus]
MKWYHTDMNQIERRKFKTMNSVKLKQPVSIQNDPWEVKFIYI